VEISVKHATPPRPSAGPQEAPAQCPERDAQAAAVCSSVSLQHSVSWLSYHAVDSKRLSLQAYNYYNRSYSR
jgi:hypothetical protein